MQNLEKLDSNPFIVPECTLNHNHTKPTLIQCCEVLIDFRTCLVPPPKHCSDIKVNSCIEVKIDKVCGCKILIGGILHKKIMYSTPYSDCNVNKHIVHKDIPFSCYVDFDCASLGDTFKISGYDIICEFSEAKKIREAYSIKTIFIEKDIIKIAVQSN